MPLSEVPLNHVRRNGQLKLPHANPQHGKLRPTTPNGDENGGVLQKPSSIQSMLRNTTETANVGQFSIKPSRVASSIPRPSPSQRSPAGSYYSGYGEYNGLHNGRNGRHTPSRSRQGAPSSNGSVTPKHSYEHFRGPHRAPLIDDYRSYSMTQSSYANRSLTQRHQYDNGHHQGRGGWHNLRPRSPFAYPTRLRRPGYRPSSPALSDLNRSVTQQTLRMYRDPSTRTPSPSSAYNTNRAPSPWQQGLNRSDPMLHHYPLGQSAVPGRVSSPSQSSIRPPTPKPSSSMRSVESSSHLRVVNDSWGRGESPPSSPMFYDYTEAFEEPDLYQSASMTTGILATQTPSETRTEDYFAQDESQEDASPAELSASDSPEEAMLPDQDLPLNKSPFRFNRNTQPWIQATRQDLSDVLELPERETQADQSIHDQPQYGKNGLNDPVVSLDHPEQAISVVVESRQQLQPSNDDHPQQVPSELDSSGNVTKPSRLSYHGSSTPLGSVFSAKSSPRLELQEATPKPKDDSKTVITTQLKLEIPAGGSDHGEKSSEAHSAHPVDSLRAPSFEGHSGAELTEILSPTPERLIASSSSRNRFSKILSIDEGLSELDGLVNPQKAEHTKDSPSKVSWTGSIVHPNVEHSWRKRSSLLRNKPAKPSVARMPVVEVLSDSEEEVELSSGLRTTFCKTEAQSPRRCEVPSLTQLPSEISRQGTGTPLSLQRPPAQEKSIPELSKPMGENAVKVSKDNKATMRNLASFTSDPDMKRPSPVDKELPPTPKELPTVISFSPAAHPSESDLPFSFTPLVKPKSEKDSITELEAVASSYLQHEGQYHDAQEKLLPTADGKPTIDRKSAASPLSISSRPWNLDTSYPWNNHVPELEVTTPDETQDPVPKLPRFKLKVHRASSSTGKLTKLRRSSEIASSPFALYHDILQGPNVRRKREPSLTVIPGQLNSSHAMMQTSPQQTRFVESFEQHSPLITLLPPSPGHEVRSFFSDDSSQVRPKGSFRKRFSDLKARIPRAASSEEKRSYDRGLLNSALGRSRASGRSSRQSEHTAGGASHASRVQNGRWSMFRKLRVWWHSGEDRVRDWGWKMRYRRGKQRAASTPLYAGV